ncbi:cell division protein FtsI [Paenibacillus sp. FSL H7-0326]|uniref:peptidoglycan D,D-transpeptidase FtsI family protein n=1 Tax=Paenibacillus sp. FSL H7-0326 TaxID=1921144 RepID=UPI00096C5680|nr:penicillin-binding transpeptidase domain-containing protein [Paenibacillus sp. FSL H7-0326]OMC64801.1 cell division protein FtsI [Paenibacillus sp. FSL H7-0326]
MAQQQNHEKEELSNKRRFSFRLNFFFFSSFIIFSIIIIRLAVLQFVEGPVLAQQESSSVTKSIPLLPVRGTIYDATGETKLAYSEPIQSLYITLYKNYSQQEGGPENPNRPEAEAMAEKLAEVFAEYGEADREPMSKDDIINAMDLENTQAYGYTPRLIKSDLSEKEIAYFMQHKKDFPGVSVIEETVRKYDEDSVAVQAIGYLKTFKTSKTLAEYDAIDKENSSQTDPGLVYSELEYVGVDGLERQYQDELRGKAGYSQIPINPLNLPEEGTVIQPPQKGHNLISSIHKDIQVATEEAIMDQLDWLHSNPVSGKLHPNAKTGFAVAMEVETGNIVAMASMPDYDPNKPWDYDKVKYIYRNGTVESFPPDDTGRHPESTVLLGSTVKPLSVLIGLKEGFFSPNGTVYQDRGIAYFGRDDSSVRNSQNHVYGPLSAATAIEHSSNAFMVDLIGEKLWNKYGSEGVNVWDEYMKEFGLGVETGVDLPKEYEGFLEYTNEAETSLARLAYASFGQQGKYTTMQLAQYATMLANKGKRMEPHLVKEIRDSEGNVVEKIEPKVLNEVEFSDTLWETIHRGMNTDVSRAFSGFPYDFARKTGTSEQDLYYNGTRNRVDNGVFIAFAPRENPKLAVAVVVPEGGFGSSSAAPIARKIFDAYDQAYGLDGVPKGKPKNTEGDTTEQ